MEEARDQRDLHGRDTVLFLDEIHRFTKAQQDALLPGVENRWVVLVAATTENPSFSVISPLLSRSLLLTLRPLDDDDVRGLVGRALTDPRGLAGEVTVAPRPLDHLVRVAGGDARRALTALEAAAGAAAAASGAATIQRWRTPSRRVGARPAAVRYDRDGDQHYDVASALIKSMRGSDVDASLHYLARMLEAGEDPRFVARRIVIAAREDVGMADPTALQTAVAAAQAVQLIGMPEARIVLAQAVVHLAMAPKSNAAYLGIDAAIADVRAGRAGTVPGAPARRALRGGQAARARQGLPVPARRAARRGRAAVRAGRRGGRASTTSPTERGVERDISGAAGPAAAILRGGLTRGTATEPVAVRPHHVRRVGSPAAGRRARDPLGAGADASSMPTEIGSRPCPWERSRASSRRWPWSCSSGSLACRSSSSAGCWTRRGAPSRTSRRRHAAARRGDHDGGHTNHQLERVDTITTKVGVISDNGLQVATNVSALTALFAATLGSPVIKVAAFSYGVRQAMSGRKVGATRGRRRRP